MSELFRTSQVAQEIYTRLTTLETAQFNPNRVTFNPQIGTTYTLVEGDPSKFVTLDNAAAITVTIPPDSGVAWAIGDNVDLCQTNEGQVTIAPGVGVTIHSARGLKLRTRYSAASVLKTAANEWLIIGDLEA